MAEQHEDNYESEIHSMIMEYFEENGFTNTALTYDKELAEKSIPITLSEFEGLFQKDIVELVLNAFNDGISEKFWSLWEEHITTKIIKDQSFQNLEFSLHIYFAIYNMIINEDSSTPDEIAMKNFKRVLESKGSMFCETEEFVSFYALPFVPNPKSHSIFKVLFEVNWRENLKTKLLDILHAPIYASRETQLFQLYEQGLKAQEMSSDFNQKLQDLKMEVKEKEFKSRNCFYKLNKLKEDHHNLIGIAAELVDSLEQCVRGKMVTPEYLIQICDRLFKNNEKLNLSKPGNAGGMVHASLNEYVVDAFLEDCPYEFLDFPKIKMDLAGMLGDRHKALLIQALIWRLTKQSQNEVRRRTVTSYINADIFGCYKGANIEVFIKAILTSTHELAIQYLVRFINVIASFEMGRFYLSDSEALIAAVVSKMLQSPRDSLVSENILGALQKLSLRRSVQDMFINGSLVEWLIESICNPGILSDYCLEYTIALLMNLCLRNSGKKRCILNARRILGKLIILMSYDNLEIRPFINGILYSLLSLPSIQKVGRDMGLEETLQLQIEGREQERQIYYIIKQLNVDFGETKDEDVTSENEEEDEDEEGDPVEMELEKKETIYATADEREGEALLSHYYLKKNTVLNPSKSSLRVDNDVPYTRPVTPAVKLVKSSQQINSSPHSPSAPVIPSSAPVIPPLPLVPSEQPHTPITLSPDQSSPKSTKMSSGKKKVKQPSSKKYKEAFTSRPKVPRTPDTDGISNRTVRSPPPLTRSISPIRPSSGKKL